MDKTIALFLKRVRKYYPKHRFKARVEMRLVVDDKYITQQVVFMGVAELVLKKKDNVLLGALYDKDIKELEKE